MPAPIEYKSMSQSKTLKFNAILGAAAAATQVPEIATMLSPNVFMWLTMLSTVGNMYFRMKTGVPIDPTK